MTKDCNSEFTDLTYSAASAGLLWDGPFEGSSSITDCKKYMCKNIVFAQGVKVLVPKQQLMINQCIKLTMCYASKAEKNIKLIQI